MKRLHDTQESGFSLIELLVALTVLLPLVLAIGTTNATVTATVETENRSADGATAVRRASRGITGFVRPAKLSTVRAQAVMADVTAGRASSVGEWIAPTDLVWRPGIEFDAASGLAKLNGALDTSPRRLTFDLEPGEAPNGLDDDGDGLVDEGAITLLSDAAPVALVRNIEECAFALDGRIMMVRLQAARRDSNGRLHRALVERRVYLRNN